MSVIKFLRDIAGLFNWNTDDSPTSETDYMAAVKNWQETERNLVDTILWQPLTEYAVGNMVKTPSLPSQYCLVCTTAGTSGANEPTYSSLSVGDSVSDGSVTWKIKRSAMTDECLGFGEVTYNAANVVEASNAAYSGVTGTITVIGGHLVLFDVTFDLKGDSTTLGRTGIGEITNSALIPRVSLIAKADVQNTQSIFAGLSGNNASYPGGIHLVSCGQTITNHSSCQISCMYWI